MKILLVRHGETEFNKHGRYMGQLDIPLNEVGKKEAEQIGKVLKAFSISAIYSSDLKRASETAEIIKKTMNFPQEIILEPALRELNLGKLEGTYLNLEIQNMTEQQFNAYLLQMDGESLIDFNNRVWQCFQSITEKTENDQNIVIVSHGGSIRVILSKIIDPKYNIFDKIVLDNGSLTILNLEKIAGKITYRIAGLNISPNFCFPSI